jgi:hypothetical protein
MNRSGLFVYSLSAFHIIHNKTAAKEIIMRRKRPFRHQHAVIFGVIIIIFLIIIKSVFLPFGNSAEATVEKFYSYEQKNNYSDSWELFHPYMKAKFPKPSFIQDRSHVFIGHFGAESFTYKISDAEKVENWRPAKGEPAFKVAYRHLVTQYYVGKYGKFSFVQEVYTVKHKGEWAIVWDYNE